MQITELILDPLSLIIILGIIVYLVVFIHARKAQPNIARTHHDLAFACIIEPLTKASTAFRAKFSDIPKFSNPHDVHLVRFGLFNVGFKSIEADQFRRPMTLTFTNNAEILSAGFSEAVRTAAVASTAEINGNRLTLSPLRIKGGGSVIFNLIVQADPHKHVIDGNIDDIENIRPLG
ncbi:MAG: hypothetical protein ACKVKG_14120 [Alphaproteobacteria bacterium]|jgi:hypothetical protein